MAALLRRRLCAELAASAVDGGCSTTTTGADTAVATSLADELWASIGRFLSARELGALLCVSRRFSLQGSAGADGGSDELPPLHEAAREHVIRLSKPIAAWTVELRAHGASDPRSWPRLLWDVEGAAGVRVAPAQFTLTSPPVADDRPPIADAQGSGRTPCAEDTARESPTPPQWLRRVNLSHEGTVATGECHQDTPMVHPMQVAVCDDTTMRAGRHYCEFQLLQPGVSSVGLVGADFDPDRDKPPRLSMSAGWMLDTSLGLALHDQQPLHQPGGLSDGEVLGLLLDMDGGTIDVVFNGKHQSGRHWDRRYYVSSSLRRPLRWAVEVGGSSSIRIQAQPPPLIRPARVSHSRVLSKRQWQQMRAARQSRSPRQIVARAIAISNAGTPAPAEGVPPAGGVPEPEPEPEPELELEPEPEPEPELNA